MLWLLCSLLAADPTGPAFDADILPLLARAGCNSAACHGGASGRGGFKLSLFGGDPAADFDAIVRQYEGRRVNQARPADSLLLDKATGLIDHGGGVRFDFDGPEADLLRAWIAAGTPRASDRRVARIAVEPAEIRLAAGETQARLRVVAYTADGVGRDITPLAIFLPADEAALAAESDGTLTVHRPGRHVVVVRYLTHVAAVPVLVPTRGEANERSPAAERTHWIDAEIDRTLAALAIAPGPDCGDATFLRRLRLDLTGRLPTPEEVAAWNHATHPDKRSQLIDRLLAGPDFVDYWTWQVAGWLRLRLAGDERATTALYAWLKGKVAAGVGYDRLTSELLLAEGDSHDGPAAFHLLASDARLEAELVSEALLGLRVRCANCHNHPLDRWTQDDYHGLAAIFARLERGRFVRALPRGEVTHPGTGRAAVPRLPGDRFLPATGDARGELAAWMTQSDSPWLARATVNRLWQAMFGRGLVEPVDDLRATNPATHPELLERLTADFVAHGYDLRHTLRTIVGSAAYARASRPASERDLADRFYAWAWKRPLAPEVYVDAIGDVTGVPERFATGPNAEQPGPRAVALVHPAVPSRALDALGRCGRGEGCESQAATGGGLAGMLHRLNGPLVNDKLSDPAGQLAEAIAAGRSNEEIVATFYRRALGREPNAAERGYWKETLDASNPLERRQRLEDFVWSLLACEEFTTR